MYFPLGLDDLSLLLGATAIILLVTSEILQQYHDSAHVRVDKKKLRNAAIAFSIVFLVTVAIKIISISFPH